MNPASLQTFLFDLDGTLTIPILDFDDMRRRLNLPEGVSISHELQKMEGQRRVEADSIVEEIELEAARAAKANAGAIELIEWLQNQEFSVGIITRNHMAAARVTLDVLGLEIEVLISRHCVKPKPAPDPVLMAMSQLQGNAQTTLMTGDYLDDLESGRVAGTYTCLLTNHDPDRNWPADLTVATLTDLHRTLMP